MASAFHDPPVSIATAMKILVLLMSVYILLIAAAALSAAEPACVLSLLYY